ncbi:MAG: hypothetical protein ACREP6_01970, partial [Candidatus Binataceae bacterium]
MRPILYSLAPMLMALIAFAGTADATDFYELQIYYVQTTPRHHVELELHSSSITSGTGEEAFKSLPVYQIHNTIEATYGLLPWLEIGQYLCTARLDQGTYEYAGGRSKVHFGIPQTESWPIAFGMNLEVDYMRRAAVNDPLTFEVMPIVQIPWGKALLVGNFTFSKQFAGPGTHQ